MLQKKIRIKWRDFKRTCGMVIDWRDVGMEDRDVGMEGKHGKVEEDSE